MTDGTDDGGAGWFADVDPGDVDAAAAAIVDGQADDPADWPRLAVEAGFADSVDEYYDLLHDATVAATRREVREREGAADQQLVHAVRAMDDCERVANELAERVAEWAGSTIEDAGVGVTYARQLAEELDAGADTDVDADEGVDTDEGADADADEAADTRDPVVSLARRVRDLDDEAAALRAHVERTAPEVAPNLSALAGPVLAARLIGLAGGLAQLARKPSGTVQVLGAEEALFAHLRGRAPSPKHGVIYTHEAVRGTHPDQRGSAARALAGKLAIAARVDHYSGELKPELEADLQDRIERIQARDAE